MTNRATRIKFDGRTASVKHGRYLLSIFPEYVRASNRGTPEERKRFDELYQELNRMTTEGNRFLITGGVDSAQWGYYLTTFRWLMELFNVASLVNDLNRTLVESLSLYIGIAKDPDSKDTMKDYAKGRIKAMAEADLSQVNGDNTYLAMFFNLVTQCMAVFENLPKLASFQITPHNLTQDLIDEAYQIAGMNPPSFQLKTPESSLRRAIDKRLQKRNLTVFYPIEASTIILGEAQAEDY